MEEIEIQGLVEKSVLVRFKDNEQLFAILLNVRQINCYSDEFSVSADAIIKIFSSPSGFCQTLIKNFHYEFPKQSRISVIEQKEIPDAELNGYIIDTIFEKTLETLPIWKRKI